MAVCNQTDGFVEKGKIMEKPKHHIFVCASFRASGEPQGVCHKKGSGSFLGYLENELLDRGLTDVVVSSSGCLKGCDHGPVMVIYPENLWYGGVESEEVIDEILDALETGQPVSRYLLN
jgi:(2Fe-2S) ferredoxin